MRNHFFVGGLCITVVGAISFLYIISPTSGSAAVASNQITAPSKTTLATYTPGVNPEQDSRLAEENKVISRTQAALDNAIQLRDQTKKQLSDYQAALVKALDATLQDADSSYQTLLGIDTKNSSTGSIQGSLVLKQKKIRALAEKILQHYLYRLTINTDLTDPSPQLNFKNFYTKFSFIRISFAQAAIELNNQLKDALTVPDTATINFLDATEKLLLLSSGHLADLDIGAGTLVANPSDMLAPNDLADLIDDVTTNRSDFLSLLTEYNDAKVSIQNAKTTRERTASAAKVDYIEKNLEINKKLNDLDNAVSAAQTDLENAQSIYNKDLTGTAAPQ